MDGIWREVWQGILADFSDLPRIAVLTQIIVRMLLAALLGGLLGVATRAARQQDSGPICSLLWERPSLS
jgi:putative Mg2+ transporter-C (MgtC) family protein